MFKLCAVSLLIGLSSLQSAYAHGTGNGSDDGASNSVASEQVLHSGLGTCLDAAGSSPKVGANVSSYQCHGGSNQQWKFEGNLLVNGSGLCLDISKSDNNLGVWTCHGGANQQWALIGGVLRNVGDNKCVDITGSNGASGTNVQAYSCHGQANQQWGFAPASN